MSASDAVDSVMYRWNGRRWARAGMLTLRDGAIWHIDMIGPSDGWAVGWEAGGESDYAMTRRLVTC